MMRLGDIYMKQIKRNEIEFISIDSLQLVKGHRVINKFPIHLHRRYCIGTIEQGEALFKSNKREFLLHAGDIFLINAGEPHALQSIDDIGFNHFVLCLDRYFNFNYHQEQIHNIRFKTAIISDEQLGVKLRSYCEQIIHSEAGLDRACILMNLLQEIACFCEIEDSQEQHNSRIRQVCEYIQQNCTQVFGLSDLANEARLSKYHFARLFKAEIGLTPYEYLIQLKIKYAKELMLKGYSPLEVALELGFADQSHFINLFKKHTGVTPVNYLKKSTMI